MSVGLSPALDAVQRNAPQYVMRVIIVIEF